MKWLLLLCAFAGGVLFTILVLAVVAVVAIRRIGKRALKRARDLEDLREAAGKALKRDRAATAQELHALARSTGLSIPELAKRLRTGGLN